MDRGQSDVLHASPFRRASCNGEATSPLAASRHGAAASVESFAGRATGPARAALPDVAPRDQHVPRSAVHTAPIAATSQGAWSRPPRSGTPGDDGPDGDEAVFDYPAALSR